jgi:hypothetical protein
LLQYFYLGSESVNFIFVDLAFILQLTILIIELSVVSVEISIQLLFKTQNFPHGFEVFLVLKAKLFIKTKDRIALLRLPLMKFTCFSLYEGRECLHQTELFFEKSFLFSYFLKGIRDLTIVTIFLF